MNVLGRIDNAGEEAIVAYFKALFRNLPGGLKRTSVRIIGVPAKPVSSQIQVRGIGS
jgi:hypothetical protein